MKKNAMDVIGLMSGTSLDGLDIAFVRFEHDDHWQFELLEYESLPYEKEMIEDLKHGGELNALDLKKLDISYGKWIGAQTRKFIDSRHIKPQLIVSHGHTIFHQPEIGLTHQIGDGYRIMTETGIKTVSDLRSYDVALGGQGAPLVPIGDKLLFHDFDVCLNLGGFSNISFERKNMRIAYDVCPVNTVLNHLAAQKGKEIDENGQMASMGQTNMVLLRRLNQVEYYAQKPPKSLRIEWVHKHIFPLLTDDETENILNTFCHHISFQIAMSIKGEFLKSSKHHKPKMLITGGGAKNIFLARLIENYVEGMIETIIPDDTIIDFKEAIIFAFLGLLRSEGKINALKSVTGASSDSSSGLIFEPIVG